MTEYKIQEFEDYWKVAEAVRTSPKSEKVLRAIQGELYEHKDIYHFEGEWGQSATIVVNDEGQTLEIFGRQNGKAIVSQLEKLTGIKLDSKAQVGVTE